MSPYHRLRLVKLKSRKNRIWTFYFGESNRLQHRQGESTTDSKNNSDKRVVMADKISILAIGRYRAEKYDIYEI